ncbi:hypothetical protein B0H13DRAFT_2371125 [Mycena leptocephala]|nr:hypothetical protein B0H13DRAFT_2371125 [Mycena leptocephala]
MAPEDSCPQLGAPRKKQGLGLDASEATVVATNHRLAQTIAMKITNELRAPVRAQLKMYPEFHELLREYQIMFFAETDMLPGEDEAADVPAGYTLVSLPRKPRMTGSRRGGGIALIIRNTFTFKKSELSSPDILTSLGVTLGIWKTSSLLPTHSPDSDTLMSSYIPSDSTSATPGLSAAAPFADVLRTRSEDAPLPHSTKALEAARPPVAPPSYTQKGLGKTHAAGLRKAQDSLAANNGDIPSSSRLLPLSPSRPGVDDGEPLNGPPLGPLSTKRGVTRSATLPKGALGATSPAAGAPSQHLESPVAHFGMTEYTDPKAETALHMAKRTNKDLHVLADALRVNETRVQRLEVDVNKVIIEHRLSNLFPSDDLRSTRPRSPSVTQNRSRILSQTTSPAVLLILSTTHSELYGRVEELEDVGRASREDLTARIAALEEDNSEEGSSAISVKELSVAAARRFTEITSDRNILDSAIKLQAGRLQTINGELHSENKALRKDLDALQKDFAALQAQLTRLELNTPAPSAAPRIPPILKPRTCPLYARVIPSLFFGLVLRRSILPQNGVNSMKVAGF